MATPAGSPSGQIAPAGNNNSHSPRISDEGTATKNMDGTTRTTAANSARKFFTLISSVTGQYSKGYTSPQSAMSCVVEWLREAKQHHVPQFLDQINRQEQQGSARLDPTTFEQQPYSRKRSRTDDPPDCQGPGPAGEDEGAGRLLLPSRPATEAKEQHKRLWCERVIEDLKAQIPVADRPTMEDVEVKAQGNDKVAVVYFREAAIFVPVDLAWSLVKVLKDRIFRATLENGDALGTSRISLFMAAEILKLDQYHLVKLEKLGSIQSEQSTQGIDKAKSIANPEQTTREYAACLSYLQNHSLFELWKLEPAEHRAIVEGMDDRTLRRLLGLPLKNEFPRLGRAEDEGA